MASKTELIERITERAVGDKAVYHAYRPEAGISSASLPVTLAKNTLVRRFNVIVTATRATTTQAITAAQVRAYDTPSGNTAVIDFGVPRTLSAISVRSADIVSVKAWTGAAFGDPFYGVERVLRGPQAIFDSEVRSERFLVRLSNPIKRLEEEMFLELPELPTDLEIRINGGAPVWTNPGAVQPTTAELNPETWDSTGRRVVDLRDALNALLADPLSDATASYEITVTTKVPGRLLIVEDTRRGHDRSLSYVNRILFQHDPEKTLDFEEEGVLAVPLPLPSTSTRRRVEEVHLTAIANLPQERTMPPVGPLPASTTQTPVLAEMIIDAGHAACVRLGVSDEEEELELEQLTAIRLPLAAEGDGAEVRVVLWSNGATGPSEPLPGGVSKPMTLPASAEKWTRFEFAKPVPVDADNPPWAAVLASRGTVSWALANRAVQTGLRTPDDAFVQSNVVRRGSPNGPWEPLPSPFTAPGGLMAAAGRVRIAGRSPKEAPVAPILMTLASTWTEVTPTVKGVPVTMTRGVSVNAGVAGPELLVVSRTAGTVTLRDVDVVWRPDHEGAAAAPDHAVA